MSNVTDIWLLVQTSPVANSDSTASLQLNVNGTSVKLTTASQQNSKQNPNNGINKTGFSAQFHWSQGGPDWPAGGITTNNITGFALQIVGSNSTDMWLPSSIWVTFLNDVGQYVLGPQCPNWSSSQCFSTQSSDCDGKAKPQWPLSWTQIEPIVEFTSGGLTEEHLEPNESAIYQFNVENLTKSMIFNNMVIAIVYDQTQYAADGVTIDVPIGPSGNPEITVGQPVPPGESIPVNFAISTANAKTQNYNFSLSLLSWDIGTATTDNTELYVDDPHTFPVVPD